MIRRRASWVRVVTCAVMATARLLELMHSRRNLRTGGHTVEGRWSARTYPVMVLLHAGVLGMTLLQGSSRPRWGWLIALAAMQPLRVWILVLLGQSWNTRGAVPVALSVETRGPYAVIRHPNYLVVAIELLALPLAFGLPRVGALATLANAALMLPRITEEERNLMLIPAYRRHFAGTPRLIPRLRWPSG